jgi:hypothetical protein
MPGLRITCAVLALMLASALPLAACSVDNDSPTSPTQPGPPVADTPPPTPDPGPPSPPPTPGNGDDDDPPSVTISGGVFNLSRSGAGDIDITFRLDDFNIVRADANTTVQLNGNTYTTSAVRSGQQVTIRGERRAGYIYARHILITVAA